MVVKTLYGMYYVWTMRYQEFCIFVVVKYSNAQPPNKNIVGNNLEHSRNWVRVCITGPECQT